MPDTRSYFPFHDCDKPHAKIISKCNALGQYAWPQVKYSAKALSSIEHN